MAVGQKVGLGAPLLGGVFRDASVVCDAGAFLDCSGIPMLRCTGKCGNAGLDQKRGCPLVATFRCGWTGKDGSGGCRWIPLVEIHP